MATITKSYMSYDTAIRVVNALKSEGIPDQSISLISRSADYSADSDYPASDTLAGTNGMAGTMDTAYSNGASGVRSSTMDRDGTVSSASDDAAVGATTGTVLGAGAGLLAGLGLMAIPGLGPVVAAGWLASTATGALAGAVAGGATGGIVGALTESGLSEDDSHVYAENVRRGGAIVSVRVDESQRSHVEQIMGQHDPIDPSITGDEYRRSGWKGFEPTTGGAVPFNANPPSI
ncbi:MAG: hypothetical protein K2P80_01435 [Beijerinckiaceae bacterium]|nr:hypothetical protein [Beijerinckiaceae bacterium]